MMLHAIHNLELSLKQIPSLGVDVLVLIRRYPDVFSNTSFARRTGQYKISTLIDLICVWQQMLQHFPDSMLRLDIKDIIQQAFREFLVSPALIRNYKGVISVSFI